MEHVKAGWRHGAGDAATLDHAQIAELVQAVAAGRRVHETAQLDGGLANRNYRVVFDDGRTVVLRLYVRDPDAVEKERAVSAMVRPDVPVPQFLHVDAGRSRVPHPFAITEWVPGKNAAELLPDLDGRACAALARSMGRALAPLQRYTFDATGLLDARLEVEEAFDPGSQGFVRLMRMFLVERDGARHLGKDEARRLWRCIEATAGELDVLRAYPPHLVHSDFGPENVLVADDGSVTGVLDWEFAMAGSAVVDLGQVLRPPWDDDPAIVDALSTGFREAGGELPDNWLRLSWLADLVSWAEFLTRPEPSPELIRTCREVLGKRVGQLDPSTR